MPPLLPADPQLATLSDDELLALLAHAAGPVRARALPTIGARVAAAAALKDSLFGAAADPVNLTLALYAFVKVAWVAGLVILDYGNAADIVRLRQLVVAWPPHEQRGFRAYVRDYRGFAAA